MNNSSKKRVRFSELESRGWRRDLAHIHDLESNNNWWDLDRAIQVEQTVEWQEDTARLANNMAVTYTRLDLKNRGWTEAMIRDFLGGPHATRPLNRSGTHFQYLWRATIVEEIEADENFQERMSAAAKRSAVGHDAADARTVRVRTAVRKRAERLTIDPPQSLEELRENAVKSRQSWYNASSYGGDAGMADDATVDRWCRNYLRHNCSNYDSLLHEVTSEFRGIPGVRDVYDEIIRPHIDELVDDTITELKHQHD